jgi:ketosteroid isomerase-like protein
MLPLLAALVTATAQAPLAAGDARAVVDKWLAAQNAGDFAAYEKLFAARFTGIRRSGPRTVRFNRAGWMKDRARMFNKPMTVAIADIRIRTAGSSALVAFTQTFAQGNYKDAGPKQLVIVRDAGAPKIGSERMLRSLIESPPVPADERFFFVVDGGLLLADSPDLDWGKGPLTAEGTDPIVATRRADPRKLPPDMSKWLGRRVRLMDPAGVVCDDVHISGFRLMSRASPDHGTTREWERMKAADVASEAWDLGARILVADTEPPCVGAYWAQPIGTPKPAADPGAAGDDALKARAVAQLRKSPAWKTIQKSYLDSPDKDAKFWDAGATVAVRQFHARRGGKEIKLVSVVVDLPGAGCGSFTADLWGLFEDRGGKLVPRNTPGKVDASPIGVIDSDADGDSELLTGLFPGQTGQTGQTGIDEGRVLLDGELWDTIEQVTYPSMDDPCDDGE